MKIKCHDKDIYLIDLPIPLNRPILSLYDMRYIFNDSQDILLLISEQSSTVLSNTINHFIHLV